jgi:hypothetical protein
MRMMVLGNMENLLYFLTCLSIWFLLLTLGKGKSKEEKKELEHIWDWMDEEKGRKDK